MAAKEPYDYIATATPDSTSTLSLSAVGQFVEHGVTNQVIHLGDDGSEERIALSTAKQFYFDVPFNAMTESDAGTLFDFWCNATIGNGRMRSFNFHHAYGGTTHTYVVRFDSDLQRQIIEGNIHGMSARLKVLGGV